MQGHPRTWLWLLIGAVLFLGCPTDEDDDDTADDDTADDDTGDDDTGDDDTGDDDTGDDDTGDDDTGDDDTGDDDTAGPDADGDGYPDDEDCDAADPAVNPGAAELCGDAVDSDCDGDADAGCVTCDVTVPTDEATIQGGIDGASAGQVICVEPGTYVENLAYGGAAVQVVGLSGPHLTVVDGDDQEAVVRIEAGEGPEARLSGFTLTNGMSRRGPGLRVEGASPTLSHLVVTGNEFNALTQIFGGGIDIVDGTVELTDIEVHDNDVAEHGGGIRIKDGTVTLRRGRIHDGEAGWGGGVLIVDSTVTFEDTSITGNMAALGGGLYVKGESTVVLRRTEVAGNEASENGGGLWVRDEASVAGGWVHDNFAADHGGGVHLDEYSGVLEAMRIESNQALISGGGVRLEAGAPILDQVRITANAAALDGGGLAGVGDAGYLWHVWIAGNEAMYGDGGGVWMEGSAAEMTNVAVLGNTAPGGIDGWGGGMALTAASTPTLTNVVVAGNTALHSGGLYLDGSSPVLRQVVVADNSGDDGAGVAAVGKSVPDLQYCDVVGNLPADFEGVTDPTGTLGNVSVDPLWLDTSAPEPWLWDLHLQATSTLIDAGDPKVLDPDKSPADIGLFGGPDAGGQDLDQDGSPLWWQPGPYDPKTYPGLGWDCDDLDPAANAKTGC